MESWTKLAQLADLSEDLPRFARQLALLAERLGINLADCRVDHIAVRCHRESTAQRWFEGWSRYGRCFRKSLVNGRPIALFDLPAPLPVGRWSVDCLELPWPGPRRYPHEGWEHIEIVLPGPADTLSQRALTLLDDTALSSPDIHIRQSAPYAGGEALPNPTLAVSDGITAIKFHPHSLREVAASEG
ncbi:VOC family protein [Martelella alba]|uniref:VOC family protein n=1 Tax=Martelella alba TaxID=2590451 RepID=A0ABY2SQB0_9HYPH|nr:VOC family protein [Martelella alba]TKI08253.1 VOC family protein [Martelella alba]